MILEAVKERTTESRAQRIGPGAKKASGRWAFAVLLFLAACNGGSAPVYRPPPAPAGAWPAVLDLGLACTETVPPACTGTSEWVTFDRPGKQGQACVSSPACFHVDNGVLAIDADTPGFPIMRRATIDGAFLISMAFTAACKPPPELCYIGPVGYAGELAYRAIYFDRSGITIYTPIVARFVAPAVPGRTYTLGLEYDGDRTWTYRIDGVPAFVETSGSLTDFPTKLGFPVMPSIWAGGVNARVQNFRVMAGHEYDAR